MADGKSVVYPVRVNGVDNVWLKPLDGSPGRQLTEFSTGQITVVRPSHNAPMSLTAVASWVPTCANDVWGHAMASTSPGKNRGGFAGHVKQWSQPSRSSRRA